MRARYEALVENRSAVYLLFALIVPLDFQVRAIIKNKSQNFGRSRSLILNPKPIFLRADHLEP